MANNCLVTKLKAVVDNDNLVPMNVFRIYIVGTDAPSGQSLKLRLRSLVDNTWASTHIKAGGNIQFGSSDGATDLGTDTIVSDDGTVYFTNSTGYIDLYDKEHIAIVRIDEWGGFRFDLSQIKYMRLMKDFISKFSARDVTGKLSDIEYLNKLEYIDIPYSAVTGNIDEIGSLYPRLLGINVKWTKITGSIERFLEGACTVGDNRTIDITALDTPITFHNNLTTQTYKCVIDANGVTVKNASLTQTLATYTKATGEWTYE